MGETWVRGRLVTRHGVVEHGLVVVAGAQTRYAGAPTPPTEAPAGEAGPDSEVVEAPPDGFVLPGLVDVHVHGGGGASFNGADPASVGRAAAHHRGRGTTSVVASIVTDRPEAMLAAVSTAAEAAGQGEVAGIHVEGPFLSRARCGAQDPRALRLPDPGLARELLAAGRGHLRVMTIAPELPGADDLARLLLEHEVVPAVGHTEADHDRVRGMLAATREALGRPGLVTHLFNGMPALHHRDGGPVAGALGAAATGDARVELIADGVHVADHMVRTVFDLLGPERVILVTDAMAAAGMPDGTYDLGPQRVVVRDGVARLGEGAPLAGGTSDLLAAVRRCVRTGVDLVAAVAAATVNPARSLGLDAGVLAPGGRADLVVTDADLRPVRVMRGGAWV